MHIPSGNIFGTEQAVSMVAGEGQGSRKAAFNHPDCLAPWQGLLPPALQGFEGTALQNRATWRCHRGKLGKGKT